MLSFQKIGEGKTKEVYYFDNTRILLRFKDTITAGDGQKRDLIPNKGVINAQTSAILFRVLESRGINTHYIGMFDERTMIAKKLNMIPLEIVARKIATGSIIRRLPIKEGEIFDPPIVEFFLKNDALHDPLLNNHHIRYLKLMNYDEINKAEEIAIKTLNILYDFLKPKGLILYDLKIELGRDENGELIIGDEISLDSMRVREEGSNRILDKDLYRKGAEIGIVKAAYEEFLSRIMR